MSWLFLGLAIVFEVAATLSLRMVATGRRRFMPVVLGGYVAAYAMLSLVLRAGMPLGVAYGVWAAAGVALTALLARVIFAEPLTPLMAAGIVLIAAGVLIVELGAH